MLDWGVEPIQVQQKRHQHAGGEVPLGHQIDAHGEDRRGNQFAHRVDAREIDCHRGLRVNAGGSVSGGNLGEAVQVFVRHSMHLGGAQPGDGFMK